MPGSTSLCRLLALPEFGLSTVFVVSFVSATLLPMGSEPAVFGLVKLNPGLFWPAIGVATAGNTLGGAVSWWMGLGAHHLVDRRAALAHPPARPGWLERLGPARLPAVLAAGGGRPAVRRGRLAASCRSGPAPATWPWASSCATWS
jgi:membrane protein YqaA with SNARE-associated domain